MKERKSSNPIGLYQNEQRLSTPSRRMSVNVVISDKGNWFAYNNATSCARSTHEGPIDRSARRALSSTRVIVRARHHLAPLRFINNIASARIKLDRNKKKRRF